jgi:hypothetical protein
MICSETTDLYIVKTRAFSTPWPIHVVKTLLFVGLSIDGHEALSHSRLLSFSHHGGRCHLSRRRHPAPAPSTHLGAAAATIFAHPRCTGTSVRPRRCYLGSPTTDPARPMSFSRSSSPPPHHLQTPTALPRVMLSGATKTTMAKARQMLPGT